jgi:hypothetical protein
MSKRAVVGSALLAATLAACSGGHSGTSMPLAGPAAVSGTGSASTSSAGSSGSQSTGASGTSTGQLPAASAQTITGGALSYSAYGIWNQPGANPMGGAFATGIETTTSAMPKTGTANYAGGASGVATSGTASVQLSGSFNATADFGHMTVAGNINMNQTGAGGVQTPYDSYAFNAGFAAGNPHFSGTMTAANNTALSGVTSGSFYGSQAQEIGGTFALQGGGTSVIGAYGGSTMATQPTAITGTSSVGVDFSNRTVSGTLALTTPIGTANSPSGTISLSGGAATFAGTISSPGTTGTALGGTTSGALFGPAAATTSGVFTASGAGATTIGAFGGAKH